MYDMLAQVRTYRGNGDRPRILLIMPPKVAGSAQPHLGLGILASRLAKSRYRPLVLDYSYTEDLPEIEVVDGVFEPDLVGVSLFSQNLRESEQFLQRVRRNRPDIPIIVGGPHVSLANDSEIERILRHNGIATIVRGEADLEIVDIVDAVLSKRSNEVVTCSPVPLIDFCRPDFSLVLNGLGLQTYPIQLSRGCPFRCCFCNIARMSGRKYRTRSVDECLEEIAGAVGLFKNLQYVKVTDDAPNCLEGRFEEFLAKYVERGFPPRLEIMQLRADHLTLEMCKLMKKAGAPFICLGVESADPEVLADVNKGETLDQIERACGYVKSCDLPLVLCFVLGLPGSTRKTDMASLDFAVRMQPIHCYWNIAQPMPGTRMHEYFKRNGTIHTDNPMEVSSLDGECFADTPAYSRKERVDVQMIAQATTNERTQSTLKIMRKAASRGISIDVARALMTTRLKISPEIPRRW